MCSGRLHVKRGSNGAGSLCCAASAWGVWVHKESWGSTIDGSSVRYSVCARARRGEVPVLGKKLCLINSVCMYNCFMWWTRNGLGTSEDFSNSPLVGGLLAGVWYSSIGTYRGVLCGS